MTCITLLVFWQEPYAPRRHDYRLKYVNQRITGLFHLKYYLHLFASIGKIGTVLNVQNDLSIDFNAFLLNYMEK